MSLDCECRRRPSAGNPVAFQSRVSMAPCWAAAAVGGWLWSSLPATLHSTQISRPPEQPSFLLPGDWPLLANCQLFLARCSLSWAPAGLLPAGLCHTRLRAEGSGRTAPMGRADKIFQGRVGAEGTLTLPSLELLGDLICMVCSLQGASKRTVPLPPLHCWDGLN